MCFFFQISYCTCISLWAVHVFKKAHWLNRFNLWSNLCPRWSEHHGGCPACSTRDGSCLTRTRTRVQRPSEASTHTNPEVARMAKAAAAVIFALGIGPAKILEGWHLNSKDLFACVSASPSGLWGNHVPLPCDILVKLLAVILICMDIGLAKPQNPWVGRFQWKVCWSWRPMNHCQIIQQRASGESVRC